jgi:hypothetical protein
LAPPSWPDDRNPVYGGDERHEEVMDDKLLKLKTEIINAVDSMFVAWERSPRLIPRFTDIQIRPGNGEGVYDVSFNASVEFLAQYAGRHYAEGLPHSQVTKILERACPSFRDVMIEIVADLPSGDRIAQWAMKPKTIILTMAIG